MIPKASQRGGGQDLATHLLNAFDNEYVEVAEVSGAIAPDLHGAFAEWEAVAHGLTRCRNYLYSLSINPDPEHGPLSRDQYRAYADRVEKALGLEGQPRALVFHIKDGREHCHVVWSRIDYQTEKAVHIAFDREKLMMVTREFAREHGLALPKGYGPERSDEPRRKASAYERAQERATGLSKEERMVMVTQAWRQSDSPRAFVRALEDMGYILATGNRPYVLVDIYGAMNALPKLIDDRAVRTKDIRAFLSKAFPPESLPTVDEARALAAQHRKAREQFAKARDDGRQREQLARAQAVRREKLIVEQAAKRARQEEERRALARQQLAERQYQRGQYLAEVSRIRQRRAEARPTGLAAFLGRVTGVSAVIRQVHRYQDARRYLAFRNEKRALTARQGHEVADLERRHAMQALDMARHVKALDTVDARERKALEERRVREQRAQDRGSAQHMPALSLDLKPRGRGASVRKAKNRHQDTLRGREDRLPRGPAVPGLKEDMARAAQPPPGREEAVDLRSAFAQAADDGRGDGGDGGDDGRITVTRATRRGERERTRGRKRGDFERER
ncbi:Relaxase/mobilization nuclease family protein [Xanthobacter versatilis]|uniref:Relaxase/mobilization nuclease family protein n=1 Tax=Xanthobacter autotrophicus (strain ATCC BAA-1158 / Py2) TaxID=78245 RepID=A7ICQ7_XANP2|nr:Relaxase/mobilization nuclease family protein [Xanthobacter autotrophicus Py2]